MIPKVLIRVILEYVPSCWLNVLSHEWKCDNINSKKGHKGDYFYKKLILSSQNLWRHITVHFNADISVLSASNTWICLKPIFLPKMVNTKAKYYYEVPTTLTQNERFEISQIYPMRYNRAMSFHVDQSELISSHIYIPFSVKSWNKYNNFFIPIEWCNVIKIHSNFDYYQTPVTVPLLSKYFKTKNMKNINIEVNMQTFFIRKAKHYAMKKVKSLIINGCDLTKNIRVEHQNFSVMFPNVTKLLFHYYPFDRTSEAMFLLEQFMPFHYFFKGFKQLNTIIVIDSIECRLLGDMLRNNNTVIFPENIINLWYPHCSQFDWSSIKYFDNLCLDTLDIYNENNTMYIYKSNMNHNIVINNLYLNINSIISMIRASLEINVTTWNNYMNIFDIIKKANHVYISGNNIYIRIAKRIFKHNKEFKHFQHKMDFRIYNQKYKQYMNAQYKIEKLQQNYHRNLVLT